jgi:hypothetical protein
MNWEFLNNHRVTVLNQCGVPERYWSDPSYGCNGMFVFVVNNQRVRCIASDGGGWKHVSVSIVDDKRCPKWEMMCAVKDLFWEEEDCVVQFHPPKSEYVNLHSGCLHLWQSLTEKQPTPPSVFVGPK